MGKPFVDLTQFPPAPTIDDCPICFSLALSEHMEKHRAAAHPADQITEPIEELYARFLAIAAYESERARNGR